MNLTLDNAIVNDIETFPNCFTLAMETLRGDTKAVWEISQYRDDRKELLEFFRYLSCNQIFMIGFNNLHFDYVVCHLLWQNPTASYEALYDKAMQIIKGNDRYAHTIWASDRFAPQIDIYKIHHFDNRTKTTNLKQLQINMRSDTVVEMPIENGKWLTEQEITEQLIPYNQHDVTRTKDAAIYSTGAIEFRLGLVEQFGIDVMNWNDTKIGEQMVIKKMPENSCYDRSSGRRQIVQTPRTSISFKDIIFPYIRFDNPEFQKVLEYFQSQTLRSDDLKNSDDDVLTIKTEGVFSGLEATVGGVTFHYGVGGIHGSLERQRIVSTDEWLIRDIDVASLYPNIAIQNKLAPEHLGAAFVEVYSTLPVERKRWQTEKGKKCGEANALKLASNGVYGKSNSKFSPFFDPQYTMTVTVNGQLLLSMLIEKLVTVPTIKLIQANTDGVTYYIHKDYEPQAEAICREWEQLTLLTLEDADYDRMFIRDVNNYIAVGKDGSVKLKGAYWTPDPQNYHQSIAESQPPAWHKNFSNVVSVRAAVANMIYDVDIEQFIRFTTNPYDFTCAVKINKSDKLMWGDQEQQKNCRFYISKDGEYLKKVMPPKGKLGAYKKANGIADAHYEAVMQETGGQWDERVCTKNKSKYEIRKTSVMAGQRVTICNDMRDFNWNTVDYDWYISEARKLLI